jgi:hypothetical protein
MSHLTLTQEQYDRLQAKARKAPVAAPDGPKASSAHQKYRNRPTGGYASRKEAKRAQELRLMQQAGEISDLMEQVSYEIIPKQYFGGKLIERECRYVADFVYQVISLASNIPEIVVEDCKGMRTPDYKIKRKLMLKVHGIRILET